MKPYNFLFEILIFLLKVPGQLMKAQIAWAPPKVIFEQRIECLVSHTRPRTSLSDQRPRDDLTDLECDYWITFIWQTKIISCYHVWPNQITFYSLWFESKYTNIPKLSLFTFMIQLETILKLSSYTQASELNYLSISTHLLALTHSLSKFQGWVIEC
jgi:hypothetical protein